MIKRRFVGKSFLAVATMVIGFEKNKGGLVKRNEGGLDGGKDERKKATWLQGGEGDVVSTQK